ncbi:phage terminase small subunit P27 family [Pediococcus ethanolidurans]|uniref:phage terminase small subunit P27 family n=1 Tax=Pediococcus ethanolidurans TaxID=319653 RepID=UPI0021E952DF|nr:phage terminase small subunit P27 family [Pediococcus ethanolidurans]MCV3315433.1 phage terminase small subunit P27 family [Pediococcus ethanolidurans]
MNQHHSGRKRNLDLATVTRPDKKEKVREILHDQEDYEPLKKRVPISLQKSKYAADMWRMITDELLTKKSILKDVDVSMVESYCMSYQIFRDSFENIQKDKAVTQLYEIALDGNGDPIVDENGKFQRNYKGNKRNPAVNNLNDAIKNMKTIGAELGLSPSSRAELLPKQSKNEAKEAPNPFKKVSF